MSRILLVTAVGETGAPVATGALEALAEAEAAGNGAAPVLVEVSPAKRRAPTILASAAAKKLEQDLRDADPEATVAARGTLCLVQLDAGDDFPARIEILAERASTAAVLVIVAPPGAYRPIAEALAGRIGRILLVCEPDPGPADRALLEIAAAEAGEMAGSVEVSNRRPGRMTARRALAGACIGGAGSEAADGAASAGTGPAETDGFGRRRVSGSGLRRRLSSRLGGERAQATPLVLGAVFALVAGTVVLVAIAGAITGKGQAQRAADLSALSAARSMKDDLPRLLAPATLPNGLPNPAHMSKSVYLMRARLTAVRIGTANGASPLTVSVRFPDALSYAPVTARVSVSTLAEGSGPADPVWAEARVGAPAAMGAVPAVASGGGYSGPLAERQGHGMRPDTAAAFDRLAAAAVAAGVTVVINSAFRSDAEQAVLFAANPDPRWVAPPGTSLHRCGTELDLGPASAYGWLAANAARFGFVKRYSWEPWHFGYSAGPAPCSQAGNRVAAGGDRSQSMPFSVPAFVPARFRRPILVASMRWGVSAALLAAQLMAESNFDPTAVSSAGARGIAQFMPGTAATYGLRDPFDPEQAIDAQAHLMSDLLKQFGGKPALALAAYNAGPGAVATCDCIPGYPETQAYVTRILAMLGGSGVIAPLPMEIELVG